MPLAEHDEQRFLRFAFLSGGSGGTGTQEAPNLPGQSSSRAGSERTWAASTNEDEVILVDRSNLVLRWDAEIQVFEEVGSATLTVRIRSHGRIAKGLEASRTPQRHGACSCYRPRGFQPTSSLLVALSDGPR